MRCSDFTEWIAERLEGALSERKAQELEEHLSACARCRAELALQRKIHEALREEVHSGLSPDFTRLVSEKTLAMARRERRVRVWAGLVPAFALGATAVALFFVGAEVARTLPAPMGLASNALFKPIAWLVQSVFGVFAGALGFSLEQVGSLGRLAGPSAGTLVVTILGSLPAIWGFHRIYVFMKE